MRKENIYNVHFSPVDDKIVVTASIDEGEGDNVTTKVLHAEFRRDFKVGKEERHFGELSEDERYEKCTQEIIAQNGKVA